MLGWRGEKGVEGDAHEYPLKSDWRRGLQARHGEPADPSGVPRTITPGSGEDACQLVLRYTELKITRQPVKTGVRVIVAADA